MLILLSVSHAAAYEPEPPLLRELLYQAETIVLATPADEEKPVRFILKQQLKGTKLNPGTELEVDGLAQFFRSGEAPELNKVQILLLFLSADPAAKDRPRFRLLANGVRCGTSDRRLWRPEVVSNPLALRLSSQEGADWGALVQKAQTDLREVNRLEFLRGLPPGPRRNQALLDWVEHHRKEFSTSQQPSPGKDLPEPGMKQSDLEANGWGELEDLPFTWVLDSAIPADCWHAVQLYAELHNGACLGLKRSAFGSPMGRQFLVGTALQVNQLDGQRARALKLLASPATLQPKTQAVEKEEKAVLLERLLPFLQLPAPTVRGLAAAATLAVSRCADGPGAASSQKVLPALVRAYKAESAGQARDLLAEAVRVIGGDTHWQQLTGQSNGLAVYVQDLGSRDEKLFFWLSLRSGDPGVHECPTLVLERIDDKEKVVEKKTMPLPVVRPSPTLWNDGWKADSVLHVEVPVSGLSGGNWRMSVTGTAGPDRKLKWTSEPRTFEVVVQKPKPGTPVPNGYVPPRSAIVPPGF
jgi:hypothetical protein